MEINNNNNNNNKPLEEIIDFERSVERTEKSLIFNDEFFKKCEIVKYRFLFEKYDILYFKSGTCCKNWGNDIFFIEKMNFSNKYQYRWHPSFKFVLNDIDGYENMLMLSESDKKICLVIDTHTRAEFQSVTIASSFDELIDGLFINK